MFTEVNIGGNLKVTFLKNITKLNTTNTQKLRKIILF